MPKKAGYYRKKILSFLVHLTADDKTHQLKCYYVKYWCLTKIMVGAEIFKVLLAFAFAAEGK